MDPFELLKADHKKVAGLFDRLESSSRKRKLDVFKQIKSELDVHTHIEEKIFYPALEKPEETHDLTLEAYEEHKVVKTLLAELSGAKSADDEWQAKAKVLRENVEHHVEEEENELFDKADDALSDEELQTLGNKMEAEKARKLGQPIPKSKEMSIKSSKSESAKPGLIATIANFVGLGTSSKKPAKKAKKKKTAGSKSTKKAAKAKPKGSKSTASKTTGTRASSTLAKATTKRAASKFFEKTNSDRLEEGRQKAVGFSKLRMRSN
ncbi:MAG TPA: hemerythrin domain-containing protein [Pyrinomonadaceae bacterium]|jgi:Hemerythrin HHE cation binding domain.|nr:hemerythrin domain-containing protein [Pyrinomonadaceae bacterium]